MAILAMLVHGRDARATITRPGERPPAVVICLQPSAFCLLPTVFPRPGGPKDFSPPREPWDSFCDRIPKAPAGAKDEGQNASTMDRMP